MRRFYLLLFLAALFQWRWWREFWWNQIAKWVVSCVEFDR
jgi:hypothetical protein